MAASPAYSATARCAVGQVTTANTNRDGTGTIATIFTAGASGSRIDQINVKAVGTTTAGMIRFYIHDGTNARLISEMSVLAITPSASLPSWESQASETTWSNWAPIVIPTGYSLRASTEKTETFNVFAVGGDF